MKISVTYGISPNVIKVLNTENKKTIFDICSDYFDNVIGIKQKQLFFLNIFEKDNISNSNNVKVINILDVSTTRIQLILVKIVHRRNLDRSRKLAVQIDPSP